MTELLYDTISLEQQIRVLSRSIIGSLSKGVFERRTSIWSEVLSISFNMPSATKFVFISVFSLKETTYPKIEAKINAQECKKSTPFDVRRSKNTFALAPCYIITHFDNLINR